MKPKPQPQKHFDMEAAGSLTPELEHAPHSHSHTRTVQQKDGQASAKRGENTANRGERS